MEESFALSFIDLITGITQNDLELTKSAVENLNSAASAASTEAIQNLFITQTDIHQLEVDNESFMYFLDHYIPIDEYSAKGIWDLKSRIMGNKFANKEISAEELNEFITSVCEDNSSLIREYRYIDLIRLALLVKNYSFIIKLKQQILEGQE